MLGMTIPVGLLAGGPGRGFLLQLDPLHYLIQTPMYEQAAVVQDEEMQQLLQGPFGLWRNGKLKEITVIAKRIND